MNGAGGVLTILVERLQSLWRLQPGPCARITDVRDDMRVLGTKVDGLNEELDTKADSKDIRALGSQLDRLLWEDRRITGHD